MPKIVATRPFKLYGKPIEAGDTVSVSSAVARLMVSKGVAGSDPAKAEKPKAKAEKPADAPKGEKAETKAEKAEATADKPKRGRKPKAEADEASE